ncbi:MAG TPA: DUF3500 domain-containing protein [Steroidobacteraceae bacterium]|nr:DUF3500 domain-containing protein [Steroidobacteraceae bacterium]
MRISLALALLALTALPVAADQPCRAAKTKTGAVAPVIAALEKLRPLLSVEQRAAMEKPFDAAQATHWSNLPIAIVPRTGLRLGDLTEAQATAARAVFAATLSACGLELLDEVRLADDYLAPFDKGAIGWNGGNYYLSVLGAPSAKTPWMLQLGGHHLAYNVVFNGHEPGATPLFFGSEPIRFEMQGKTHEPVAAQSTAMSTLAAAIATHPGAKLSGTFTDVVKGVIMKRAPGTSGPVGLSGGVDSGFPHSYPTGDVDRGVRVGTLNAAERQLVRAAIESYATLPGNAISAPLLAAYEDAAALDQTYVGFAGATDFSVKGSYVRIDGPRVWMEMVVQPAIAKPEDLHFHALWRDKTADYGGEVQR